MNLRICRVLLPAFAGLAALATTGCHHNTHTAYQPPPPSARVYAYSPRHVPNLRQPSAETPPIDLQAQAAHAPRGTFDDVTGTPVFTETGMASWYGTVYNHHAAADGTTFEKNDMTAAHRTLPMGSTVRVTNLATGQQVLVRITDRGPFSHGRILDLSMGAAKAIGVYNAGVAKVKVEAFAHSTPDPAGKWCVQTGAFKSEDDAEKLKSKLVRRYNTAKVTEFAGPTGYWVRIDPSLRSKTQATEIADWIGEPQPEAVPYLVRIN